MVRAVGEPIGDADLSIDLTGRHGDSGLLAGGDDFLHAQLAVAENGDESNKHRCPSLVSKNPAIVFMQGSCQLG